jgi:hypothetical protein
VWTGKILKSAGYAFTTTSGGRYFYVVAEQRAGTVGTVGSTFAKASGAVTFS